MISEQGIYNIQDWYETILIKYETINKAIYDYKVILKRILIQ